MRSGDYRTLADVPGAMAREQGDKTAVVFQGETTSYADLDRRSDAAAARLQAEGVEAGDRVAILARNSTDYVILLFAVAKAGAVATPLNWRLSTPELAYIVGDAEAALLVVDPALSDLAPAGLARTITVAQALAPIDTALLRKPRSPQDLALLIYTSGTTGRPKGVMLTHANFARYCDLDAPETPHAVALIRDEVSLAVLPLFHIGGIEYVLRPYFTGGTTVLHQDFDVARILQDVQTYRVTLMGLVPTAMQMMLRHPDCAGADFSSVRRFIYGASPIPADLLREGLQRLHCEFLQSYGMTETACSCAMLAPEDHHDPDSPRLRAAGRAMPGVSFRILDAEGRDLPARAVGEIVVKGAGVMAGYWRNPAATDAALQDGWLRTGDAGYLDEDGYLYVHDRVKDMIISGAENIYPAEVESAIYGHPAVAEAAVVGVPDPVWGESVKAVVVPRPGAVIDEGELIAWIKTRIASFKAPRSVDVVSELPKNAAGKVLRRMIRDRYWAGRDRAVS